MGTYHMNDEVDHALIRLNDAICSWERATSREYTLILVPHNKEENIQVSVDGKPSDVLSPLGALDFALQHRDRP